APRARPRRGPDPLREGHWAEPLPVAIVPDQLSVADRGHAGGRSDRLDPAPARSPGEGRAEDAAVSAVARDREAHPRTTPVVATHPAHLALGPRPRCS